MDKFLPKVGDKLYLRQDTGNEWIDMVHKPYTVVKVSEDVIVVQECKLIFYGTRYYDTLPDEIEEDPYGETKILHWDCKKGYWKGNNYCRDIAVFGRWDYQPYLN